MAENQEQQMPRETKQVRSTPTTERKSAPLVTGVRQPKPQEREGK
jgi:hypothetical protein